MTRINDLELDQCKAWESSLFLTVCRVLFALGDVFAYHPMSVRLTFMANAISLVYHSIHSDTRLIWYSKIDEARGIHLAPRKLKEFQKIREFMIPILANG